MSNDTTQVLEQFQAAPVVPVITLERVEDALPLSEALMEGGLTVLEVTLRTKAALPSMEEIAKDLPDAFVAAGTIITPTDLQNCLDAGAKAAISPGATAKLLQAGVECPIAFMPGVATASEAMVAQEYGFQLQKFFPAQAAGGLAALKGFSGPLADIKFCPTGGVNLDNMADFLRLPNVVAVGGSWMVPSKLIQEQNFAEITKLAREAVLRAEGVKAV